MDPNSQVLPIEPDLPEFTRWVKRALDHLYDRAYLSLNPLAVLVEQRAGHPDGGSELYRVLMEGMERLRPAPRLPADHAAWRPYLALHLRYVDGLDVQQVAQELRLSPRQFRREHARGIATLAQSLWSEFTQEIPVARATPAAARDQYVADQPATVLDSEIRRLSRGQAPIASTPLAPTVKSVLATLADLLAQHGFELSLNLPSDLPSVAMDRVVLRQILLCILGYIVDHTDESQTQMRTHSAAITIEAYDTAQQVRMAITSSPATVGPDPRQAGDERLAVAARLLHMHGATLTVTRDTTTSFRVVLSAHQAPTVLAIDDNPDMIRLFRRYLAGSHCRLIGATTSRQALQLAQESKPCAILLDVMMPDQDGWELLQRLKNLPATGQIPVIVCSVLKEEALASSLGAAAFLPKPVTQQSLLAMLAPYMEETIA